MNNKRTYHITDFAEKIDKYLNLNRKRKMGHESDGDTNPNWHTWNSLQRLKERIGNQ